MNHYFGLPRLAVTGRLLLPTGEHWLVEVGRPGAPRGLGLPVAGTARAQGDPDPTVPIFRWQLEGLPAHVAACVRPFGDDLARREIEIEVFGPQVDDSWLPVLS